MTSYIVILEGLELSYAVQKYPFEKKYHPKEKCYVAFDPFLTLFLFKTPSYDFV